MVVNINRPRETFANGDASCFCELQPSIDYLKKKKNPPRFPDNRKRGQRQRENKENVESRIRGTTSTKKLVLAVKANEQKKREEGCICKLGLVNCMQWANKTEDKLRRRRRRRRRKNEKNVGRKWTFFFFLANFPCLFRGRRKKRKRKKKMQTLPSERNEISLQSSPVIA